MKQMIKELAKNILVKRFWNLTGITIAEVKQIRMERKKNKWDIS